MLFPNEKIIYEVPIYSMPEKEFKRRWDNWKKNGMIDPSSLVIHQKELRKLSE